MIPPKWVSLDRHRHRDREHVGARCRYPVAVKFCERILRVVAVDVDDDVDGAALVTEVEAAGRRQRNRDRTLHELTGRRSQTRPSIAFD